MEIFKHNDGQVLRNNVFYCGTITAGRKEFAGA
jgi:hypothetical protein